MVLTRDDLVRMTRRPGRVADAAPPAAPAKAGNTLGGWIAELAKLLTRFLEMPEVKAMLAKPAAPKISGGPEESRYITPGELESRNALPKADPGARVENPDYTGDSAPDGIEALLPPNRPAVRGGLEGLLLTSTKGRR